MVRHRKENWEESWAHLFDNLICLGTYICPLTNLALRCLYWSKNWKAPTNGSFTKQITNFRYFSWYRKLNQWKIKQLCYMLWGWNSLNMSPKVQESPIQLFGVQPDERWVNSHPSSVEHEVLWKYPLLPLMSLPCDGALADVGSQSRTPHPPQWQAKQTYTVYRLLLM